MAEVTSKTIKAYARSLKSTKVALQKDLDKLGYKEELTDRICETIEKAAEDAMSVARAIALTEFEKEWGKP